MSSPYRLFQFVHRITKTQSSELINLTHISKIEVKKNRLYFTMAHEKKFFFGGGGNVIKYIHFDTENDAKQEFDSIHEQLNIFYKQNS